MGHKDSTKRRQCRRDGWTAERQLEFLAALHSTRSVSAAAGSVGMSRESAYRLYNRPGSSLFGALWDRALAHSTDGEESHAAALTNGRLMRLLGDHYRRKAAGSFPPPVRQGQSG
jgi:hypothetical protein